jgi:hypothetical protein
LDGEPNSFGERKTAGGDSSGGTFPSGAYGTGEQKMKDRGWGKAELEFGKLLSIKPKERK